MINPSKHTKNRNSNYSLILNVCINTRKVKAKFNNFQILLYIGYSSTVVMGRPIIKLKPKEDATIK